MANKVYRLEFLCIVVLYIFTIAFSTSQPEVTIRQGVVRGLYKTTISGRRFSSFEGIPYALPVEGKYRFEVSQQSY